MNKQKLKVKLILEDGTEFARYSFGYVGNTIGEVWFNKGKVGFPEYVGVVKDFLLVIENKASISKHIKLDDNELISKERKDIKDFAVNGALFYGQHLAKNTTYKKVLAFGISGNEKKHKISPIFIDETEFYRELPELESFISFNEKNIEEYYIREILKEETNKEIDTIVKS